jgi:hypothetical protein
MSQSKFAGTGAGNVGSATAGKQGLNFGRPASTRTATFNHGPASHAGSGGQTNGHGGGGNGPLAPPSLSGKRPPQPESFYQSPPETSPNKGLMIGVAACGAALLMFGLGMIWRGSGSSASASSMPAPPQTDNLFTEQQRMMREAMDMAKEAQKMNRERMEMMRRQIEMAEEGPGQAIVPSNN